MNQYTHSNENAQIPFEKLSVRKRGLKSAMHIAQTHICIHTLYIHAYIYTCTICVYVCK